MFGIFSRSMSPQWHPTLSSDHMRVVQSQKKTTQKELAARDANTPGAKAKADKAAAKKVAKTVRRNPPAKRNYPTATAKAALVQNPVVAAVTPLAVCHVFSQHLLG